MTQTTYPDGESDAKARAPQGDGAPARGDRVRIVLNETHPWQQEALRCLHFASGAALEPGAPAPAPRPGARRIEITRRQVESADNLATAAVAARAALADAAPPHVLLVDVRPAPSPASLAPLLDLQLPLLLLVDEEELDPQLYAGAAAVLLRSEMTPYWLNQSLAAAVREAEHGRTLHQDAGADTHWIGDAVTLSRAQFSNWLRSSPVFLSRTDTNLRTVWSENAHPDWPPERTLGRRPEEYLGADAAAMVVRLMEEALATGKVVRGSYENEVQGRPQRIALVVEPLLNAGGATIGLAILGTEETDSRLLHESLRMSDESLREVLQQTGHSLARIDADRRYVWYNNGERMTPMTQILGRKLGTLPPGLESPRFVEMVEYVISTGTRAQLEYTVEDPSLDAGKRSSFDVHIKASRNASGDVDGALIFAMDVTRYRRLAETLSARVDQLRTASELARLTMLQLAPDSTCLWVGPWGGDQTFTAYIGQKLTEAGPLAVGDGLRDLLQRAAASAASASSLFAVVGEPQRWFEVTVLPQYGDAGELSDYHAAAIEVTSARRLAQQLQVTSESLRLMLAQAPMTVAHIGVDLKYQWSESGQAWAVAKPGAGTILAEQLPSRQREQIQEWARSVMATGKAKQGKFAVEWAGEMHVFSTHLQPTYDDQGAVNGLNMLSLDITPHEQMTAALQQSERRYRRLIEATTASVWQMNADCSAFLDPSPSWHSYTGAESTETLDDLLEAFHPEDIARVRAAIADAVTRGVRLDIDARVWHRQSAAYRWMELRLVPLRAEEKVVEWVGAALDVDDREQARQGAREREEDLATLLDILPVIVFIAQDAQANHIVGNEAGRRILRLPEAGVELSMTAAEELRPNHFRVLLDGREVTEDDLPVQHAARTGQEWIGSEDLLFDDGSVVSLMGHSRPLFDAAGAVRGSVAAFMDVTEQRATTQALARSEQRLRLAAEVANIGLWEWDGRNKAVWNRAQCEFFGVACDGPERLVDPWETLSYLEGMEAEAVDVGFAELFARGEGEWAGEYRVQPPNAPMRVLKMSGRIMRSPQDRELRMIGVTMDITQAWEMDKLRDQAQAELELRVQLRTQDLVNTYSKLSEETAQRMMAEANLLEIRRLLGRSQDLERVRLAHELHDGPMQELAALAVELTLLSGHVPIEASKTLLGLRSRVREVAISLRSFAGDLRPPVLDSFGISAAIQAHVEQMQERHPEVNVTLDLPAEDILLEESIQTTIYRVFQQALYNIYQHANADEVLVSLAYDASEIALLVQDNGVGFQVPETWMQLARSGHLGIVGMTERASGIGGSAQINSAPGQGTRIEARFPLRLA